jgi:flagellar hook protein FlgE
MLTSTQYGSTFSVNTLKQDGFTSGRLSSIDVDTSGVVFARYTNGRSQPLGQVALSNFANPQGLRPLGDTTWGETFTSGDPIRGSAGTSSFGLIQSGALESSNVDLTQQLVNMITAQRNFQANAQMISTADQVTQTIINIR